MTAKKSWVDEQLEDPSFRKQYLKALRNEIHDRESEIDRLRARVAELEQDAARLDAIESGCATVHCNFTHPEAWSVTPVGPEAEDLPSEASHGMTLRDAIDGYREWRDAARAEVEK